MLGISTKKKNVNKMKKGGKNIEFVKCENKCSVGKRRRRSFC